MARKLFILNSHLFFITLHKFNVGVEAVHSYVGVIEFVCYVSLPAESPLSRTHCR